MLTSPKGENNPRKSSSEIAKPRFRTNNLEDSRMIANAC